MKEGTNKIQSSEDDSALRLIIDEQRRDYDYLLKIYDRAGAKENVLLAAGYGIVAYLYSSYSGSVNGNSAGIIDRLFIPSQDYGLIIYMIAAAFFIYGLFKLTLNVFGDSRWETAYETSKKSYSKDSYNVAAYIKKRYDAAHKINLESYIKRKSDLKLCFYCILISAIILIVIKTLK